MRIVHAALQRDGRLPRLPGRCGLDPGDSRIEVRPRTAVHASTASCVPSGPARMKLSHGQRARNVDGNREQSHRVRKADGARLVVRRRTVRGAVEEIPRRRPRSSHPGGRFTSARQAIRLDTGSTLALAAGMCAVVAMAVQNAVEGVPSTPGMTTNISRFVLALGDLMHEDRSWIASSPKRVMQLLAVIAGFVLGCAAGAAVQARRGPWGSICRPRSHWWLSERALTASDGSRWRQ